MVLAYIIEPGRIIHILVNLTPKVFGVHRERLVLVPNLDKPSAVDIPIHNGNYRFGWKSNDAQVLVIGLDSHRGGAQFDNTFGHRDCLKHRLMQVSGSWIQNISLRSISARIVRCSRWKPPSVIFPAW